MRVMIASRDLLAALIIGCVSGTAVAQTLPNPTGLTESDIAPCSDLLSIRTTTYKERTDLSNLDFALSNPPYSPVYDVKSTREWLAHSDESVAILEAHDEARMLSIIGIVYRGQQYDDRLATDRRFSCLLRVRLAQLTGKKPVAAPPAQPAAAKPRAAAGDTAFQSNLKTYQADQLLALTNELIETGQIDLAKLARNALLQRFPDSPLVPLVAQLISNAPKAGAAPAPAASSRPSQPVAGQRIYMNDGAQLIAAFASIGVVMNPGENSRDFIEAGNRFRAILSDCRDGTCHAIQLIARYSFTPMPTFDKVDA